jgi:hypothetical protein
MPAGWTRPTRGGRSGRMRPKNTGCVGWLPAEKAAYDTRTRPSCEPRENDRTIRGVAR